MSQPKNKITICYFGIYNPELARNKIFITGLKENGVEVIECYDHSRGLLKYINLFIKHWKIRKEYGVMIVGYGGYMITPLAKLLTRKPIIFDAFFTLHEQMVLSRDPGLKYSLKSIYIRLKDRIAIIFSDLVLVETENQKKYFIKKFKLNESNCRRLYTGADNSDFYPDENIKKEPIFTVLFRGRLMPEAGVKHVLAAARILKEENINFNIIGYGILENEARDLIAKYSLTNTKLISKWLENSELRKKIQESHVSLGQFEDHERLQRTIPHKAYESLAMKIPYITGDTLAASEFFVDRVNCLKVALADPENLADKILELKNDSEFMKKISENGYELYKKEFSPVVLGSQLKNIIINLHKQK